MAVEIVSSTSVIQATSVSTIEFEHVNVSSTYLVVMLCLRNNNDALISPLTVTYNGDSLTQQKIRAKNNWNTTVFTLENPSVGANQIVCYWSGQLAFGTVIAYSINGVDLDDPIGTPVSGAGQSTAPTKTASSEIGGLVIDGVTTNAGGSGEVLTVGPGQVEYQNENVERSGTFMNGGSSTEVGAASVVMSWTGPDRAWSLVALPIKPAALEDDAPLVSLMMM